MKLNKRPAFDQQLPLLVALQHVKSIKAYPNIFFPIVALKGCWLFVADRFVAHVKRKLAGKG
jgi:hypothetical protein